MVVHDLLRRVAGEIADATEVLDDNVPGALSCEDRDVAVLGDTLQLRVGLAHNVVDLVTVLGPDVIEVFERSVNVSACARDQDSVALGSVAEPVEGLVGLGCRFLELLGAGRDVVLGGLGGSKKVFCAGLAIPDIADGEGGERSSESSN